MPDDKFLMIDSTKEDDVLQVYPCSSLLSSKNMGWDGIHLEHYCLPPHSVPECCLKQHLIAIHTQISSEMQIEQKIGDRFGTNKIRQGDIIIVPANATVQGNWNVEHYCIDINFSPEKLLQATDLFNLDAVELMPCFQKGDPLILGIGLALKTEIESGGMSGQLYADSLINTLAAHLLHHYSTRKFPTLENTSGLSKNNLRQVIEYINDNIDRNFTLAELAAIANLSPSYFSSLFKLATGYAPHQYLIRCRVERAKILLKQKRTIADIAYSLGFSHQSHLNRHFKKIVGITPKAFRQQK